MEVLERMLSGFWPEAPSRCTAISWAELEQVLGMKNKMHQLRKWFYSVRCNKEKSSLIGAISKEGKGPWERGRYKMESSGRLMGVTRKDGVGSFPSESFEEEWKWLIFKYLRKGWWFLVSQFFRHKRVGAEEKFCEEKQNFRFGLISFKISVRFHSEKSLQHFLARHRDECYIQHWILMLHVKMCDLNNQFYFISVSRWSLGIIFLLYKYFCF